MCLQHQGIVLAGTILTDIVKTIDAYPQIGMLANISSVSRSVGGCVPNTGIDLAKIDREIPLTALGCVGDDEYGRFVLSQLQSYGIHTDCISVTGDAPTSFSDVMSLPNGERTFFHARGANALFTPKQVRIDTLHCKILHVGYLLLLDEFDKADTQYGTVMARFLHDAQQAGIQTSIDSVSDCTANFSQVIIPALRFCDYVIVNEIECTSIWDISPRDAVGNLSVENIFNAMKKTISVGVREKVIVHSKEAGFCLSTDGSFTIVPSLSIPASDLRGSVGAGDAFCAGCLYGIYHGLSDREILEFASAAAACNLFATNSVDGMRSASEIRRMMERYPRRVLDFTR